MCFVDQEFDFHSKDLEDLDVNLIQMLIDGLILI